MTDTASPVRPLRPGDAGQARALLAAAVGGTPYAIRLLELLDQALAAPNDEVRGLVAERGGTLSAVALHGAIAGSEGAARLHVLAVAAELGHEVAEDALMHAVAEHSQSAGARFVSAELPDDPAVAPSLVAPLLRCGFREEARVADFFRDGVDLLFLRLPLASPGTTLPV